MPTPLPPFNVILNMCVGVCLCFALSRCISCEINGEFCMLYFYSVNIFISQSYHNVHCDISTNFLSLKTSLRDLMSNELISTPLLMCVYLSHSLSPVPPLHTHASQAVRRPSSTAEGTKTNDHHNEELFKFRMKHTSLEAPLDHYR